VTTDHISPAGAIRKDSPAGEYLQAHGVAPGDFNSYGSRRGNHDVMIRGTFANIRLRNQLVPGTEGGFTRHLPDGQIMSIFDAATRYAADDVPLMILAGAEYGSGSSRDWAAKGTLLLGVRAVLATSFERIHRSNLIGMGAAPAVRSRADPGEPRSHRRRGVLGQRAHRERRDRTATGRGHRRGDARRADQGVPRPGADRHPRRSRLLPPRWNPAGRAATTAREIVVTLRLRRALRPDPPQDLTALQPRRPPAPAPGDRGPHGSRPRASPPAPGRDPPHHG